MGARVLVFFGRGLGVVEARPDLLRHAVGGGAVVFERGVARVLGGRGRGPGRAVELAERPLPGLLAIALVERQHQRGGGVRARCCRDHAAPGEHGEAAIGVDPDRVAAEDDLVGRARYPRVALGDREDARPDPGEARGAAPARREPVEHDLRGEREHLHLLLGRGDVESGVVEAARDRGAGDAVVADDRGAVERARPHGAGADARDLARARSQVLGEQRRLGGGLLGRGVEAPPQLVDGEARGQDVHRRLGARVPREQHVDAGLERDEVAGAIEVAEGSAGRRAIDRERLLLGGERRGAVLVEGEGRLHHDGERRLGRAPGEHADRERAEPSDPQRPGVQRGSPWIFLMRAHVPTG